MPETNFNGRSTRMARSVRKLIFASSFGNSAMILGRKIQKLSILINCHNDKNYRPYAVTMTKKSIMFHAFLR